MSTTVVTSTQHAHSMAAPTTEVMGTSDPKKAVTPREGDQRAGEPKQSPTPGSFAGLVSRKEDIAKPRTRTLKYPGDMMRGFEDR